MGGYAWDGISVITQVVERTTVQPHRMLQLSIYPEEENRAIAPVDMLFGKAPFTLLSGVAKILINSVRGARLVMSGSHEPPNYIYVWSQAKPCSFP